MNEPEIDITSLFEESDIAKSYFPERMLLSVQSRLSEFWVPPTTAKTPRLIWFAQRKKWQQVEIELNQGADVTQFNKFGRTVFDYLYRENAATTQKLLKKAVNAIPNGAHKDYLLRRAALFGWTNICRKLIQSGVNPNQKGEREESALCIAAMFNRYQTAKYLLEAGANVNQQDFQDFTPLMWATLLHNEKLFNLIMRYHPDVKLINIYDHSALSIAAWFHNEAFLHRLLKAGAPVEAATENTLSPFLFYLEQIYKGEPKATILKTVKAFLKAGADLNERGTYGDTAIISACASETSFPKLVQLLINAGADLTFANNLGQTPLICLIHRIKEEPEYQDVTLAMLQHDCAINYQNDDGESALFCAIAHQNRALTDALIEKGANPNIISKKELTPLALAIAQENCHTVMKLLKAGANPNLFTNPDVAPVTVAIDYNMYEIIPLLARAGATLDVLPLNKIAPLTAILKKDLDRKEKLTMLRVLLDAGANPNFCFLPQNAPLYEAITDDAIEETRLLLAYGADPDIDIGDTYKTPLMYAVSVENAEMTELLLSAGADISQRNICGDTAVTIAGINGSIEILKMLLKHFPPLNDYNENGSTILIETCKFGDPKTRYQVVSMLLKAGANPLIPDAGNCLAINYINPLIEPELFDFLKKKTNEAFQQLKGNHVFHWISTRRNPPRGRGRTE